MNVRLYVLLSLLALAAIIYLVWSYQQAAANPWAY